MGAGWSGAAGGAPSGLGVALRGDELDATPGDGGTRLEDEPLPEAAALLASAGAPRALPLPRPEPPASTRRGRSGEMGEA